MVTYVIPKLEVPKGKLAGYEFNPAPPLDAYTSFYIQVHNQGDAEGQVFAIIRNKAGNPASVKVLWKGEEWTVAPGGIIALRPDVPVAPCSTWRADGQIKYEVEGEHALGIEAWHKNPVTGIDEGPDDANTVKVFSRPIEWPELALSMVTAGAPVLVVSGVVCVQELTKLKI